jgi:hypothetical protein
MPGPYGRRLGAVGARHASPASRTTIRYRSCEMTYLVSISQWRARLPAVVVPSYERQPVVVSYA